MDEDGHLGVVAIVLPRGVLLAVVCVLLDLVQGADEGAARVGGHVAPGPAYLSHSAVGIDGDVWEGEEHIANLAGVAADGGVGDARLDSSLAAGHHTAESVGAEVHAEDVLDLRAEDRRDLIAAQVGHRDGVVAVETELVEGDLRPREEVLAPHRFGEALADELRARREVLDGVLVAPVAELLAQRPRREVVPRVLIEMVQEGLLVDVALAPEALEGLELVRNSLRKHRVVQGSRHAWCEEGPAYKVKNKQTALASSVREYEPSQVGRLRGSGGGEGRMWRACALILARY
mmetsp:Transcript_44412/g.141395  ORF Transcript_44412/g.141395 Transcript_44412/m.141395 type:complete len:290 (+) Transcript_44412:541-1410(+)